MTHVTCRLTAKNRGQLRNLTLGNRVWATFTFFTYSLRSSVDSKQTDTTDRFTVSTNALTESVISGDYKCQLSLIDPRDKIVL